MKRLLFHSLFSASVHKCIIPLFLINLSSASHADTNHSLARFFDDSGYNANVSNPTAYQGQSANYYTSGSLFVRNQIVDAQLVSVTVPSISTAPLYPTPAQYRLLHQAATYLPTLKPNYPMH